MRWQLGSRNIENGRRVIAEPPLETENLQAGISEIEVIDLDALRHSINGLNTACDAQTNTQHSVRVCTHYAFGEVTLCHS